MPMTIFQLAKDMKLDFGLMWISIIVMSLMYGILYWENKFSHKKSAWSLALVWLLIWVTFSIKITSLLLLLGVIGMLFYKKLSLWGVFWFFSAFVGIFTFAGVWGMMNVVLPPDFSGVKNTFSFLCIIISFILLFIGFWQKHKGITPLKNLALETTTLVVSVLLGFILALLPWGTKNIWEVLNSEKPSLGISRIIWWYSEAYRPAYQNIYTEEEIQDRKDKASGIGQDGTTTNEDFWRYFWYEKWINNYLKLPWNLTFQVNQKGEFTDISFVFFALIPGIFLFLPYRKESYKYPVFIALLCILLYYIPGFKIPTWFNESGSLVLTQVMNPISTYITHIFSQVSLPIWYIFYSYLYL